MFYVSLSLGAVFVLTGGKYYLIGMAIDSDGVIAITQKADDLTATIADYGPFCKMTDKEVIAKFAITPTTPMLPMALVTDVPDAVTVHADLTTVGAKQTTEVTLATLTGATLGGTVTSSDTGKVTVAISGDTITYTPVAVGTANVTLLVEDSQSHYADATFVIPVTVAKRELKFLPIDDQSEAAGHAKVDIVLDTVDFDKVLDSVVVYSTDNEIVAVTYADDGTNAVVGTISCTPHATQKGEVEVIVKGVDAKSSTTETVMSFKFRVE